MKKWIGMTAIAIMVVGWSMAASAADWKFYGSARMATFITDVDNPAGTDDTKNYEQDLQTNSRIGARVRSGDIRGRFEYGNDEGSVTLRHLYGEWRFGDGSLIIGQTNTPYNFFTSNQVYGIGADSGDTNLLKWGGVYSGREPMIQLGFGNFKFALVRPSSGRIYSSGSSSTSENTMPEIQAKYRVRFDNGHLDIAGLYNTYEFTNSSDKQTHDIDSFLVAVGGTINLGAGTLSGNIWGGENAGRTSIWNEPYDLPRIVSGKLVDNTSFGFTIVGAYKFNDMFRFEAGYGYTESELDHANYEEDATASYYLQTRITLAKGVYIIPEIGVVDHKNDRDGDPEEEIVYYGIQWKINF